MKENFEDFIKRIIRHCYTRMLYSFTLRDIRANFKWESFSLEKLLLFSYINYDHKFLGVKIYTSYKAMIFFRCLEKT